MQYFISFLEGIITFISPCLLPMLPVYVSYFAGGTGQNPDSPGSGTRRTVINALGFILGFTLVFVALGALAGGLGGLLLLVRALVHGVALLCEFRKTVRSRMLPGVATGLPH